MGGFQELIWPDMAMRLNQTEAPCRYKESMKGVFPTAVLVLAPALLAWSDDAHTIVQKGRSFRPGEVTIRQGETLVFTNEDSFIHQIYSNGLFDTEEKGPGENISETFSRAGTFEVRCHIHPKMRLVVHVR